MTDPIITPEELVETMTDIFHKLLEEAEENPLGIPQVTVDKRIYDLEAMRELQKINPNCWIGDDRNPYQIHIAAWIQILKQLGDK